MSKRNEVYSEPKLIIGQCLSGKTSIGLLLLLRLIQKEKGNQWIEKKDKNI